MNSEYDRVGHVEYDPQQLENIVKARIATTNGYYIQQVATQYGNLYYIEGTKQGFLKLGHAVDYANRLAKQRPGK